MSVPPDCKLIREGQCFAILSSVPPKGSGEQGDTCPRNGEANCAERWFSNSSEHETPHPTPEGLLRLRLLVPDRTWRIADLQNEWTKVGDSQMRGLCGG